MSKSAWYFVKVLSKGSRPEVFYSQVIPKTHRKRPAMKLCPYLKMILSHVFINDYLKKCEQIYKNGKKKQQECIVYNRIKLHRK